MIKTLFFSVILIALFSFSGIQVKKKIIFFGDSITEQGAKTGGYIRKIDSLVQKAAPGNYELAGAGIGGNKVYDLYLRMDDDVLSKNPDAVVIWVGVNDVWHKKTSGTGTDYDKFEKFYLAIIKKLKDRNIKIYLVTPAAIGEKNDCTNDLDGGLNNYSALIRNIASKNNCSLIDLRQEFLSYLKSNNPQNKDRGILTTDGVHLNEAGNQFVAEKMLTVLGKDFIK